MKRMTQFLGLFLFVSILLQANDAGNFNTLSNAGVNAITLSGTNLYAGSNSGIFLSANNGTSWTAVNNGLTSINVSSMATNGTTIYSGTDGGVFYSTNNGTNWLPLGTGLPANNPVTAIGFVGNNVMVTTSQGFYFLSQNSIWKALNDGLLTPTVSSILISNNIIFIGSNDGVYKRNISEIFATSLKNVTFTDFSSLLNLILAGNAIQSQNALRLTTNSSYQTGACWYQNKLPLTLGFQTTFQFKLTDTTNSGGDGFAFVIHNTPDVTVNTAGGSLGYDGIPNSLAVEFDTYKNSEYGDPNNNHISIHTNGINANSVNETSSLGIATAIPNMKDGNVHTVKITYSPGSLIINFDNQDIFPIPIPVQLDKILNLDNGTGWVGFTASTGWATENHDIMSWTFEGTQITAVKEGKINIPTSFVLLQNYPNPFNPTTMISYQLPQLSKVSLKVYDLLGREVAILVNEEKQPGNYEVKFDGTKFSSGVYFYRIQAGSFVETKKLLLMK